MSDEAAAGDDRPGSEANKELPNVILMMSDDQGWGDAGYQGHPALQTPALDEMAEHGLRFDRWYAASPVCSPTRGSCLTGRHPRRYGIDGANVGRLPPEEITLPELLRTQGYRTGHFGKWHLGTLTTTVKDSNRGGPGAEDIYSPPWDNGFDVCFSTEARMPTWDPMVSPPPEAGFLRRCQEAGKSFQSYYWTGPGQIATENLEGDDSRVIMDRVLPFVRQVEHEDRPFFAVIWFHSPHEPIVAGPEYRARYEDRPETEQHFYGVLTAMDEQIDRLRGELRRLGIADNTMLWFCSDNGPAPQRATNRAQGETGPFRNRKGSLYEGGIRVPGLLEWPGVIEDGRTTSIPCCTSDYLPTVLDMVGLSPPEQAKPLDGISLRPLIEGAMDERPEPIAFDRGEEQALVGNRYKLVAKGREEPSYELFDLKNDPSEGTDLSPEQPERVDRMAKQLDAWTASVNRSREGKGY
jgi:arylsulfatase A-like enzyme